MFIHKMQFLILPRCHFYVMLKSTLSDQIRPRPLKAYHYCAANQDAILIFGYIMYNTGIFALFTLHLRYGTPQTGLVRTVYITINYYSGIINQPI